MLRLLCFIMPAFFSWFQNYQHPCYIEVDLWPLIFPLSSCFLSLVENLSLESCYCFFFLSIFGKYWDQTTKHDVRCRKYQQPLLISHSASCPRRVQHTLTWHLNCQTHTQKNKNWITVPITQSWLSEKDSQSSSGDWNHDQHQQSSLFATQLVSNTLEVNKLKA